VKPERIVIIGAGIAGLAAALALEDAGVRVVLLERDAAPPPASPDAAFDAWARPGVPQFRMSHSLVARLAALLRAHHPEVLRELAQAGIAPCPIQLVLPSTQIDGYTPLPSDIELCHLLGRRATFECVLRRHVEGLPHVSVMQGARATGLRVDTPSPARLRVRGVEVAFGERSETIDADVVVDASGGRAPTLAWLRAHGAAIEVEEQAAEFVYFSRHYRARDVDPAALRRAGAVLDYLWFGAFFAEHGHFSLALACPTAEAELAAMIRTPEGFDAVARSLPGVAALLDRAEPSGKVLGAGHLTNRWTHFFARNETAPAITGFFAVGDAYVQTNPMYGRGCAAAFVQAHALRDALREADPSARARDYAGRVHAVLRPQYEFCTVADRLSAARARRARGLSMPRDMRAADYFTDRIWAPAVLESPFVAREVVRTLQMHDVSDVRTRVRVALWMLLLWMRRWFYGPVIVPERSGPGRGELLRALSRSDVAPATYERARRPS
jgi:2-polyprenyl-6-methoxyphenol hydroxylase-like FAD-dependent oxidoreductase